MNPSLKFLLLATFFALSLGLNAQKIDSIKKILNSAEGINKYEALYGLAYEYSDVNDSLSMIYAEQAFNLALKLGDSSRIVRGGRIRSGQLRRLERFDQAIQGAQYVLNVARRHKDTTEIKFLLNSLGLSHLFKAECDKALKYHFESLIIREAGGNKAEICIPLYNIGAVYYKLQDYDRSIEYFMKSLELKRQVKDNFDLDRLLINLGLCFNEKGEYHEARKYIIDGLNACGEKCSDRTILEGEFALGMSLLDANYYKESLRHFEKSYEVAKHIGDNRFQAENLICFARVSLIKNDFNSTVKYLKEAEKISTKKRYRFLSILVYKLFSKLYGDIGDYKNMALFQSKYIKLNDSIYSDKVINNLAQVRADFGERENIKTITEKNQVLSLKEELLENQKQQTLLAGFIGVLLLILTVAIYKNYRDKLLANIKLDQKVKERTEELREVTATLTKAYELRESVFQKVLQDTRSIVLGIQGLCRTAQLDIADKKAMEYIQKVEDSTGKLVSLFSKVEN